MSFGGSKSSPPPAEAKPILTQNNAGVPDDIEKRGVPIRETAAGSTSLLSPSKGEKKNRMLY